MKVTIKPLYALVLLILVLLFVGYAMRNLNIVPSTFEHTTFPLYNGSEPVSSNMEQLRSTNSEQVSGNVKHVGNDSKHHPDVLDTELHSGNVVETELDSGNVVESELHSGNVVESELDSGIVVESELDSGKKIQKDRDDLEISQQSSVIRREGYCVTYGDCGGFPCISNTPAKSLSSPAYLTILAEMCPHLQKQGQYCCDGVQAEIIKKTISAADILLKTCTIGKINLRAVVCDLVCSPNQSQFVEVSQYENFEDKSRATRTKYFLSELYSDKVYNSVKKHTRLMCGNFLRDCTKEQFFNFLGDNRWTKLKTDYEIGNHPPREDITLNSHEHITCIVNGAGYCQC